MENLTGVFSSKYDQFTLPCGRVLTEPHEGFFNYGDVCHACDGEKNDACYELLEKRYESCFEICKTTPQYRPYCEEDYEEWLCSECTHLDECKAMYKETLEKALLACYASGGDAESRANLDENLSFDCGGCRSKTCPHAENCSYMAQLVEDEEAERAYMDGLYWNTR